MDINYIDRDFVRNDVGINGATLTDEDCDRVILEVSRLANEGMFHHTGVYWIANRLAGNGEIHPIMSRSGMICHFCRHEFDSDEFPIACPACGYALDDSPLFPDEDYSLVCKDGQYSIIQGYNPDCVFLGSFTECEELMEALQAM